MCRVWILLLFLPGVALAGVPSAKDRGKQLWVAGVADYDLGKFDNAIAKFEEAYKLFPNPNILYNLGQAHRQNRGYEKARFYFQSYLANKPKAQNRAEVENLVAELDRLIEAEKKAAETPPVVVQPPPPPPVEPAPPPPPPPPPPAWYKDPLGMSLLAGGVAAAGVGAGFLVRAGSLSDDAAGALDQKEASELHDEAQGSQLLGVVLVSAGSAAVVAGVIRLALHGRTSGRERRLGVAVGRGSLMVFGAF